MRRKAGLAFVLMAAAVAGCGSRTTPPTSDGLSLPTAPTITPMPADESPSPLVAWIYVGGIQVNRVSGVSADPVLDAETAGEVAMAEIASGRAQMFGTHADAPPMHMIDAAFVPGLVGVVGPAGGTDFEPAEPVAAWVVVSEGHGSDGTYTGVGIVGQNGALLASYIITPGVG